MKFNAIIPELSVQDIQKSKKFYLEVLGFKLEYERVEDDFAFISFGEAQIMIEQINNHWNTGKLEYPLGRGINFQISIDNVDSLRHRLEANGIELYRDIMVNRYKANNHVYNEKEILIQDPDGYLLRFSELFDVIEK